jgi:hypothetical protein
LNFRPERHVSGNSITCFAKQIVRRQAVAASYSRLWKGLTEALARIGQTGAMDTKRLALKILAVSVLLPGALATGAYAYDPPTAVNDSSLTQGDGNVPLGAVHTPDNDRVTLGILTALQTDRSLPRDAKSVVRVETNDQAVVLRGALPTTDDINRVESLVQQYSGARQILNELTVAAY